MTKQEIEEADEAKTKPKPIRKEVMIEVVPSHTHQ